VSEHVLVWAVGAIVALTAAALATRVQLLPDVIDVAIIPTASGVVSLACVAGGALGGVDPDRLGRLSLLGTLAGGLVAGGFLATVLLLHIL
jgi:hypothetical protein